MRGLGTADLQPVRMLLILFQMVVPKFSTSRIWRVPRFPNLQDPPTEVLRGSQERGSEIADSDSLFASLSRPTC